MIRYKTKTRPGLFALYDIRPGNGAGPFLQPRSPHGAIRGGTIAPATPQSRGTAHQRGQMRCLRVLPESFFKKLF